MAPRRGWVRMMDLVCRQGGLPVRVRTYLQQADWSATGRRRQAKSSESGVYMLYMSISGFFANFGGTVAIPP